MIMQHNLFSKEPLIKTFIFLIMSLLCVSFLLWPSKSLSSSYVIKLKNGGHIKTPFYWREGTETHFYVKGGTMGIQSATIARIEKVDEDISSKTGVIPDKAVQNGGLAGGAPAIQKPMGDEPEKLDRSEKTGLSPEEIKAYGDKKRRMEEDLDEAIERMRKASREQNLAAKEKAKADMRRISGQIYELTDQVKRQNTGGKLPDGWWRK
ncbi:MAG: hypothetical protein ABIH74_03895 [Candidatus Omnitrophota bacterium]